MFFLQGGVVMLKQKRDSPKPSTLLSKNMALRFPFSETKGPKPNQNSNRPKARTQRFPHTWPYIVRQHLLTTFPWNLLTFAVSLTPSQLYSGIRHLESWCPVKTFKLTVCKQCAFNFFIFLFCRMKKHQIVHTQKRQTLLFQVDVTDSVSTTDGSLQVKVKKWTHLYLPGSYWWNITAFAPHHLAWHFFRKTRDWFGHTSLQVIGETWMQGAQPWFPMLAGTLGIFVEIVKV